MMGQYSAVDQTNGNNSRPTINRVFNNQQGQASSAQANDARQRIEQNRGNIQQGNQQHNADNFGRPGNNTTVIHHHHYYGEGQRAPQFGGNYNAGSGYTAGGATQAHDCACDNDTNSAPSSNQGQAAGNTDGLSQNQQLDLILDLIEHATGQELDGDSKEVFLNFIQNLINPGSQETEESTEGQQAETINPTEFENDFARISAEEAGDQGVSTQEEAEHSGFQNTFYENQSVALREQLERWDAVSDTNANAPERMAEIRTQLGIVESQADFWAERQEAWQEMDEHQIQEGDNKFSALKVQFYRAQLTGLENQRQEAVAIDDNTGAARASIAQTDAQIQLAQNTEQFWVNENEYWRHESQAQYAPEDQDAVTDLYGTIEDLQVLYEQALLGESQQNGLEIYEALEQSKEALDGYKLGDFEAFENNVPYAGSVRPGEEVAYAGFKQDFYASQQRGLENLAEEWSISGDPRAEDQLAQIDEQHGFVRAAEDFYADQETFWNQINSAGFSDDHRQEIDELLSELVALESEYEEVINSGQADSFDGRTIEAKIHARKARVEILHSNL